jgi:DNA-binding CsgD family transcriptional regulator
MHHDDDRSTSGVTVVVGVDGSGRTHRLGEIAAAAAVPVVEVDAGSPEDLAGRVAAAAGDGALVVVDDAHRLPAEALRTLARAARQGVPMVIARRPVIDRPELAELDEAVAGRGAVAKLGPLDDDGVGAVMATVTGGPVSLEAIGPIRDATGGLPALVAAVAARTAPVGEVPAALVARMQQRLAVVDPATAELARILALRLDLADGVLAAAAGLEPPRLAPAMRSLHDAGMLGPDGEHMIPVVAQALLTELPPAGRRRLHDTVAHALVAAGADPVAAAGHLRAAQARTPAAADAYRAAADRLRFTDPAAANGWYDDAIDAGADPASIAAGRAEAAALLGLPVDLDRAAAGPADTLRMALLAGAVAAHQGRAGRAAESLVSAAPPGPLLAVPALMATGRVGEARRAATGHGPVSLRRFAEGALAFGEPAAALPLLIEAAETVEATAPAVVLPDTPHAVGAVVAVTAGDAATAEYLLDRAMATAVGGPAAADRHRALRAWVAMRTGRYEPAIAELRRRPAAPPPGRERLLAAALSAGIARRSGDIARLREAWSGAEPALARRAVDLFQLEALEELLVAAARLRQHQRITPVLDTLDGILDRLGAPAAWTVSVAWVQLQVAVAGEDPAAAAAAAARMSAATPPGARQRAQCAAADRWARALAGEVDPEAVLGAADELAATGLPWEASRLAGHAAIRTGDPPAARRLLERAREFTGAEAAAAPGGGGPASRAGLSDREVEVARLVLAGRTHKEIGGQLYLSPKTVEHHVARIRTKLGAGSRAELLAALRRALDEP